MNLLQKHRYIMLSIEQKKKNMCQSLKQIQALYSPDCPSEQFFSYKRCLNNVNRASGFIFEPLGL